jgi:hypothetical protein
MNILHIDLADWRFSDEEFLKDLAQEGSPPLPHRTVPLPDVHTPRHRPGEIDGAIKALRDVMKGCY